MISDLRTGAEVDLQLFARLNFHPAKGQFVVASEALDEPIDGPVTDARLVVGDEVLIDTASRQTGFEFFADDVTKRLALTAAGGRQIGVIGGRRFVVRPGRRLGTV